jgi:hypothetical protein
MSSRRRSVFVALLIFAAIFSGGNSSSHCDDSTAGVDRTTEPQAVGSDVVQATVNRISESGIFADDFGFLRRMAAVESNDGQPPAFGLGGIWRISESEFDRVAAYIRRINSALEKGIQKEFCFSWTDVDREGIDSMDVPLYSALAARAYVDLIKNEPISEDIESQANVWADVFDRKGDEEVFTNTAISLRGII